MRGRWVDGQGLVRKLASVVVLMGALGLAAAGAADDSNVGTEDPLWNLAVFVGEGRSTVFSRTLKNLPNANRNGEWIGAIALRRQFASLGEHLVFEAEGMFGQHFGDQRYSEIGVALNIRAVRSPWDHIVVTTFAIGIGPSYTTTQPRFELSDKPNPSGSRVLNQFNLELTFASPAYPNYALLFRMQHRSGILELLGDGGESNFLTAGVAIGF